MIFQLQRSTLATPELIETVNDRCLRQLTQSTRKFLKSSEPEQSCVLAYLKAFGTSDEATASTLHFCFRQILYFCICSESQVSREATVLATEMCQRVGIRPNKMLVWYKTNLFKLIVPLCVSNYISYEISLEKSLHAVNPNLQLQIPSYIYPPIFCPQISHMFRYADDRKLYFIADNCGIMIAMLTPFAINSAKCIRLIEEICDIVQKDMASTIGDSFLSIYTNLYLNETADTSEKCLQFLVRKSGSSQKRLLKADVRVYISCCLN